MAWLEFTINTAPGTAEDAAAALTAAGFSDLVIEDQGEFEDFLEKNRACWDYIDESLAQALEGLSRIRLYLEDTDAAGRQRLEDACRSLRLPVTAAPLAEADWEEGWKANYPPQEVGQRLIVLPYWEDYAGARLPVILDPGLTFGTGAHPSTQMVMEEMEKLVSPGAKCLDLGSGSGILSLTALRLGADAAIGVDIDPKAEDIARENAAYNGFGAPAFTALTGDVTADQGLMERLAGQSYDLVLVNIVADVIIGLAPTLPVFLGEGSRLICSGILDARLPEVLAALERAGLTPADIRAKEEWRCVVAGLTRSKGETL